MEADYKLDTFFELCERMDIEVSLIHEYPRSYELDLQGEIYDYRDVESIVAESGMTTQYFKLFTDGDATIILNR